MLLQGLLKYILYSSRYPSIGFICFPTSGVKGVAALYEAFQVGGGGGTGGSMLSLYWSFLGLPVTWKVRKNAAVAF